ncbi:TetR/AcrR family transcriptional regulator C-terminal domain-containing protein [Micromonospora sp. WMMD956]|uniref:TetR/AcrR family transcriptional regulator n=1 Tax=Micromonospora sp. WMMD956 TaxID=3016108 RepID=UPI0024166EA0|nr:TetR/AcrR family transcriptional regulator C-terminal domain-containing protein [Micromonospora sp. WMMD956]MDG4816783.1 TetR/AcrR family transcriptional regulator C-terminal domain-containing protein [Micromonospora sp. WMMD956]
MPRRADDRSATRAPARLSRETIVAAAIDLADRDGLAGLSMRRLAQHLGVDAMSIYYHLRDKDTLLAAMVDAVAAEIERDVPAVGTERDVPAVGTERDVPAVGTETDVPAAEIGAAESVAAGVTADAVAVEADADGRVDAGAGALGPGPWTDQLRALITRARRTMLRHPWAARVLEARDTPTPAVLRHIERVLAVMRGGGCSVSLSHHALHLLGSRILGFSQDLFDDSPNTPATEAETAAQAAAWAETMPHIAELAAAVAHSGALGGCDDEDEFAFALDLLIEGLDRRRLAEQT